MEPFSVFDPAYTGSLKVVQKGRFDMTFTLTDDYKVYGELRRKRGAYADEVILTAGQTWRIYPGKRFSRDIIVKDEPTGETVAVVKISFWLSRITMGFTDGQVFNFIRPTIFTKQPRWCNDQFGDILTVEPNLYSIKKPFTVTPGQSGFKNNNRLLLMAFMSVHLILVRQPGGGTIQD